MSDVEAWLMSGDPSVAWQTQRDLLDRSARTWKATRRRVATEGWGARLLAERGSDGRWGGGLYSPKWTSTFYTLRLLTQLGVPPNNRDATASCELLLREGVGDTGGVSLWTSAWTDTCVTAMLLSMACYFGFAGDERVARMTHWLLGEQLDDGGWNCNYRDGGGATHSSFHTTISTLEGLAALDRAGGPRADVATAADAGRAFFVDHQLYRSSRTGEEVRPSFAKLSFPPRWYFDVLRGLEHFAAVDAAWDERLSDPVALVERRRGRDGRWTAQNKHTGRVYFELEPPRAPSRMNTLRALRVLRWVERARG